MAELNELLEQAAAEAANLSEEADGASQSVDALLTRATGLAEQVAEKGEEARGLLKALKEALEQAEEGLTAARGRADASLGDLGARATELRGEVTTMLEQVTARLDELEQHKARLQDDADAQAQSVEGALADLSTHTHEAGEAVQAGLTDTSDALIRFRGAVDTARTAFTARRTAWEEAAGELEAQATEQALTWVDGIQHLLADQSTAMVEMTNEVVETHNAVMEDLKMRFAVEAREAVGRSLQVLAEELTNLAANAAEEQGVLGEKSEEILGRVRMVVTVIEHLTAGLETSAGRI